MSAQIFRFPAHLYDIPTDSKIKYLMSHGKIKKINLQKKLVYQKPNK